MKNEGESAFEGLNAFSPFFQEMEKNMRYIDLSGLWQCVTDGGMGALRLPGTLEESGIGGPDDPRNQCHLEDAKAMGFWQEGDPIAARLTRKHAFQGQARILRSFSWQKPAGKRVFLECERARHLRLFVNGEEALPCAPGTLSAPYAFEITSLCTGQDEFLLLSDNSYPGWPRDAILYSSAATDETQTNWNGLLGYVRLRLEEPDFISAVRVYPDGDTIDVQISLALSRDWEGEIRLQSPALLGGQASCRERVLAEVGEVWYIGLPLKNDIKKWDIEEGSLYDLTVQCRGMEEKTVSFGIRDFKAQDGHLTLNGRRIFLRSEANCAAFPETGHMPMDKESWIGILRRYQAYGVNCVRFHSHCPPEAAFAAADELGVLMQPELSHWDPEHAFASEEAKMYYGEELKAILRAYANHPSFVMLTLGNELHADKAGHDFMNELLAQAKGADATRLYANGSNAHYGALGPDSASDFFTASDCEGVPLRATSARFRGWLNQGPPSADHDYQEAVSRVRAASDQPIFSFEVGQYESLPDFDEIREYQGVTAPDNLRLIRERAKAWYTDSEWKQMAEASGELALLCYRAEVEAALRTEGYSGISLLGLQDFPGQGTALVGMMNAHLRPKPFPFARPERFHAFFRDALPLALLPKFTFFAGETVTVPVKMANYGKTALTGCCRWQIKGETFEQAGTLKECAALAGGLTALGEIRISFGGIQKAQKLTLGLDFAGVQNEYSLWAYPADMPVCPDNVYECRTLDEKAQSMLRAGGTVYLAPDRDQALPGAVRPQFSTDFWCPVTFPDQAGCNGQWIQKDHPLFAAFPTDSHTDWQWWPMASAQAVPLPEGAKPIISVIPAITRLTPLTQMYESRQGKGRLLVSTLALHQSLQYPEARALQRAVYGYLAGERQ